MPKLCQRRVAFSWPPLVDRRGRCQWMQLSSLRGCTIVTYCLKQGRLTYQRALSSSRRTPVTSQSSMTWPFGSGKDDQSGSSTPARKLLLAAPYACHLVVPVARSPITVSSGKVPSALPVGRTRMCLNRSCVLWWLFDLRAGQHSYLDAPKLSLHSSTLARFSSVPSTCVGQG